MLMAETEIVDLSPQPTAVVREQVRMDALQDFFGRAFGTVMNAIAAQGLQPIGPPFGYYHGMPTEMVDVEAGFPVAASIKPGDGVIASSLPGGRAVESLHVGPYDTLPETYAEVQRRIEAEGLQPASDMWEYYLTDPESEPDPATWQTRIVWPVRGADDTAG